MKSYRRVEKLYFVETFYVNTTTFASVVIRWKSFYILRKFYKKVWKTFARECNCWRKIEQLYTVGNKS